MSKREIEEIVKEQVRCPVCDGNLTFFSDIKYCPFCGYAIEEEEDNTSTN